MTAPEATSAAEPPKAAVKPAHAEDQPAPQAPLAPPEPATPATPAIVEKPMSKSDEFRAKVHQVPRVVTIQSGDNPNLLMATIAYPQAAGTAVVLDQVRPDGVPQPFAWWVLNPVSVKLNLYQILHYPHDGNLCLTAPSATANAALTLQLVAPANMLQLWNVDWAPDGQGCFIRSYHSKLDIGFLDIPLKGTPLQLTADPAFHDGADPFVVKNVKLVQP